MGKRKLRLNKNIVFIMLSILFIGFFLVIYGFRFVHYYKLEHPKSNGTVVTYFSDTLISLLDSKSTEKGLFYDAKKEEYYFKGKVDNNYVWYSGFLWRIVSITKDNKIKLITDKSSTILNYGVDEGYNSSYIKQWLNEKEFVDGSGVFSKVLYNKDKFLTNTKICTDEINDLESITCEEMKEEDLISLISLYEYNRSGGVESFVNTEEYFWTINENKEKSPWYVFTTGGVNIEDEKDTKLYGVKPVITLKEKIVVNGGKGTYEKPYIIQDEGDSTLSNRLVGEYVEFENYLWRIIDKNDSSVKVAMEGFVMNDDENLTKAFSTKKNTADLKDTTSMLYYLNNTFYKSLENKDYIIKGNFNVSAVNLRDYDYKLFNSKTIEANIGLLALGELFITNYNDYYLINSMVDANDLVSLINEMGILYGEVNKSVKNIRPVLYLDNKLLALGGNGTPNEPYVLGR